MKRIVMLLLVLGFVFGLSVQVHATLTTIGTATYNSSDYNLIYDEDLGIVWLDYSNALNNWQNQVKWAAGLGSSLTYKLNPGVNVTWTGDWRLPSTVDGPYVYGYDGTTTGGYNIKSSEMGHLFYTTSPDGLGNLGYYDITGTYVGDGNWGLLNTGDFQNLQAHLCWSGTEYSAGPDGAWTFYFVYGFQAVPYKDDLYYALAVRPGDVAAVPEPATVLLLGAGLAGLGLLRRRLKN